MSLSLSCVQIKEKNIKKESKQKKIMPVKHWRSEFGPFSCHMLPI